MKKGQMICQFENPNHNPIQKNPITHLQFNILPSLEYQQFYSKINFFKSGISMIVSKLHLY